MATAGVSHDLTINGVGFMLAGGPKDKANYKKKIDHLNIGLQPDTVDGYEVLQGPVAAPVDGFRRAIWSKWSGAGQGMVAGGDGWEQAQKAGWVNDLVCLRPVQNGGALALAPQAVTAQVDATAAVNTRYAFCTFGAITLVSIGLRIYKTANPGTNNSGFVFLGAAAANVVAMAVWNGTVYVSTSANIYTLNITTGVLTLSVTPTNRAVDFVISFQGMMMVSSGVTLLWWIPATAAWSAGLVMESTINSLEEYDGSLYIGCDSGLFKIEGQLKAKAPTTAPTVLDWFDYKFSLVWRVIPSPTTNGNAEELNFCKMVAWRGALWGFVGGRLFKIRPGSTAATLQIEEQPVYGSSRGIAVCGRWLVIITILVSASTIRTVWVNETGGDGGLGWWKLDQGNTYIYPFSNAGYNQGVVNAFNNVTVASTNFWRWLVDQSNQVGFKSDNFGITRTAVTGQVTLPLVTPEDLAQLAGATNGKVLSVNPRRVGLEWSLIDAGIWWPTLPIDGVTMAAINIQIDVSLNGGLSWENLTETFVGHLTLSAFWFNGHRMELPVTAAFYNHDYMYPAAPPAGPGITFNPVTDMGWLIRITWGGLQMPLLRRVWFDYDLAEVKPATGRTWEIDVNLGDPQIGLDQSLDASLASAKSTGLQNLVRDGTSVTFVDIDQVSYRVKVMGCELRRIGPGAMPNLAQSWVATVKLAEVWGGN